MLNFSVNQAAKILPKFFFHTPACHSNLLPPRKKTKHKENFERIQYQNKSYVKFHTHHQHERKSNSKQILILKTPNKFSNLLIKIT